MKSITQSIPSSFIAVLYLLVGALLRICLWGTYGIPGNVAWTNLPQILIGGTLQDLTALLFISLPLSLLQLVPGKVLYHKKLRRLTLAACFITIFGILFLAPTEFLFFDEFSARFNLVAVDYFAYPTEVFGNIWESYPIVWFVLGFLALSFFIWKVFYPTLTCYYEFHQPWKARGLRFVVHLMLCVIFTGTAPIDLFSTHSNRVQSQITQNGILTFVEALYTNNLEFDHYYAQLDREKAYDIMRAILDKKGGAFSSSDKHDLRRSFKHNPNALGRLNVVIIGEESLGAQYIGALGDSRGLTPNFDKLSQEGLLFENAFATGTRTVRGLEAISMSFPPIPSESTVRRSGNENMANLGEVLNNLDYNSSFLYGGFGAFDNMNYFFTNNGFNISDRLDVKKVTFSNIWGICDEDLFTHAIGYFDQQHDKKQSFFSLVMTTSNHKPFTFRHGIDGIKESGGGRDMGVKYADHALGEFFKVAKTKPWYSNTIFVVVGDHDSRVYGRAYIPVDRFKVALMILAPSHLKPRRIKNVISQIDLAPTIMGLLGLPYASPFYGQDMLDPAAPMSQPVLINHNHDVGLYQDGILAVTSLNKVQKTFRYTDDHKTIEIEPNLELQEKLTAYLQTAYEQFKHHSYTIQNGF